MRSVSKVRQSNPILQLGFTLPVMGVCQQNHTILDFGLFPHDLFRYIGVHPARDCFGPSALDSASKH